MEESATLLLVSILALEAYHANAAAAVGVNSAAREILAITAC